MLQKMEQGTLASQGSLFSMTSKMGVVLDDLGGGSQTVGMAKTVSIVSPLGSPRSPSASPGGAAAPLLNTRSRLTKQQYQQSHPAPMCVSPVQQPPQRPKGRGKKRRHLHRQDTTATMAISKDDVIPRKEDSVSVMSELSWRAHSDTIQNMVALKDVGCIFTNSLDGFHRVWNLHQECLGT